MKRFSSMAAGAAMVLVSATATLADSFFFDDSTVAASGQQITVTRLPIRKPDGSVVYRDVTVNFVVNATGQVVVKSSKTINSPPQIVNDGKLQAGKYYLASDKSTVLEVVGPQVGIDGHNLWTIRRDGSTRARFYTGPVKGHPYEAVILKSGTKADLTFGVTDGNLGDGAQGSNIAASHLVGVQSRPGELTFSDFGLIAQPLAVPQFMLVIQKCKPSDGC